MLIYWLLLFFAIMLALQERRQTHEYTISSLSQVPFAWVIVPAFIALLIGFRVDVGGDWGAYLGYLDRVQDLSLLQALQLGDPGYQLVNYLAANLGGGIFTVNLIAGTFFSLGLMIFCSKLPRPMLAIVTSVPYMIIVLAMGYTRQATALGFAMIALSCLIHKSVFRFSIWIVVAALFHKSAVLLIPIAALLSSRSRVAIFIWIGFAVIAAYFTLLRDSVDALYANYVEADYQSQGALIRVVMCLFPSLLFIFLRERFDMGMKERQLWSWFSLASIIAFLLVFLTSASTAIDRVALYLLPIQLVVFSHLPEILGTRSKSNYHWVLYICLYYSLVQFVWLFFATHRIYWLPYQFYPFTLL